MVQVAVSILLLTVIEKTNSSYAYLIQIDISSVRFLKQLRAPSFQRADIHHFLNVRPLKGVLGAPFVSEEPANEFIQLKRQTRYSQNYWDPSSSQNAWGYTLAEQVSELWTALRTTTQHYMDLGSFAFGPATAR
ncbi:uncharacterized protein C3orf85 homolog [Eretmochelys imbricata]